MKKKLLVALIVSLFAISTSSAFKIVYKSTGVGQPIHENITREALRGISLFLEDGTAAKLNEEFIGALVEENTENDEAGLDYGQLHFDNSRLKDSAAFVWRSKLAAVQAFRFGNTEVLLQNSIYIDGNSIQVNLGSAMHTIQDFFAHSTWVEINESRLGVTSSLPVPQIGGVENPFISGTFSALEILDIEPTLDAVGKTIDDKVCNSFGVANPAATLTSAYYDYQMSDMPFNLLQRTIDNGASTDGWRSSYVTAATANVRTNTTNKISWPLGRCVHGGDASDAKGINKDQSDRLGFTQARSAALHATQAFMLDYLAQAKVLASENKNSACSLILDCEPPIINQPASGTQTGAGTTNSNLTALGLFPTKPTQFSAIFTGSTETYGNVNGALINVTSKDWPTRMLSYSFEGTPCEVIRPYPLNGLSDQLADKVICPSTHVGPGKLIVFQTALPVSPSETPLPAKKILHTATLTINDVPPAIADFQPKVATINQPTTFTVAGTNLPATAELSISGGGFCATPTVPNVDPSTGFKQTCTPSGSEGTRSISVLSQAGGAAIGAAQTISVSAAPVVNPPSAGNIFFEEFNAVNANGTIGGANSSIWQRYAFSGGVCNSPPSSINNIVVSGGQITFGNCNYIQTNVNKTFSGDRYVIEGRFAGTSGGRNTYIALIENDSTVNQTSPANQIFIGDTNYSATALPGVYVYQVKNSAFVTDTRGLMPSTSSFKEYRITIEGANVKIERGDSLANLTEIATTTLNSSVSGKIYALRIGTAGSPYYPGVFDWVRVSTASLPVTTGILNPANGHRYEVITCGTWTQCDSAARAKGGNLVTIRNAAENAWLVANLIPSANSVYGLWTGATDQNQEGTFNWSSGEPLSYTNWNVNEPNNGTANGRPSENYVHILKGNNWEGKWNDFPDNGENFVTQAIVEYSLSGTFSVAAINSAGTLFTVPAGASSCQFNASGTWNNGPSVYTAIGDVNISPSQYPSQYTWPMSTSPFFALIALKSGQPTYIGNQGTLAVTGGQSVYFVANDSYYSNSFAIDNSGALSVSYQCQ
jgi:hypothetical protein